MNLIDPLQPEIDRHSRELIGTVTPIFIFVYVIISGSHILLLPEHMVTIMTVLAFSSVGIGLLIKASIARPSVQQHAELLMMLMLLLMGVNSITHMYLSADIKQTTNFVFVMAVSGYVLPGYRTFYATLVLLMLSWMALVSLALNWSSDTVHFGFEILLGAMFAMFLHTVRRGQLEQTSRLEQTIGQLNDSQQQVIAGESLMQMLMDRIPAGIVVRDSDTRILYLNQEARRLLGVENRDVVGRGYAEDLLIELFDEKGSDYSVAQYPARRVLDTGQPIVNEVVGGRRSDGSVFWALLNAFALDVEGSEQSVVVVAFADITEQVSTQVRLRESESRAAIILDSVGEGVIAVNDQQRVTLFNRGAEQLLGLSAAEAMNRPIDEVLNFQQELALAGDSSGAIQQGRVNNRMGDDINVELLVSGIQGDAAGSVYMFRDVRAQLRYEHERATLDKMKSVGVLAGGIAHDFNNLLTAIYGNVSLAESAIDDPEKAHRFLKRSAESIALATNLTKQLLTFATGSEPVRDVVDVEQLVTTVTRFSLSGSAIAVNFDVEPGLEPAEVDGGQIQQAVGNILINAKQALQDKGSIDISLKNHLTKDHRRFIAVEISDNGPGIAPEAMSKIFDPYFTTKGEGTGLGLATTHSIVLKHGGSVSVSSKAGAGATFTLLLPAAEVAESGLVAATASDATTEMPVIAAIENKLAPLHILVMDDEAIVLETITSLLERSGHRVAGAREGQQAIDAYVEQQAQGATFDLVIMDLTIAGGMGGREAAAAILAIDPNARLVVTSGYSAGAEMARYRELGFIGRLAKPFRAADLDAMLAKAIRA